LAVALLTAAAFAAIVPEPAAAALKLAGQTGMKHHTSLPEVTEHRDLVKQAGLEPVAAVMIGGVYGGRPSTGTSRYVPKAARISFSPTPSVLRAMASSAASEP
jgi:hypothetical protein